MRQVGRDRIVDEPIEPPVPVTPPEPKPDPAVSMMLFALKGLSERAVIEFSRLFTLLTVASAWYLWWTVLPNPTYTQLGGLTLYAAFLLAIHYLRRR